jgi:hypothetical protein
MTTIDFSKALADAKTVSFEPLPNGDYDIEVSSCDAVTSGNGKPMLKTKMKVISGPHMNRPIINNFTLSLDNTVAVAIFFRQMKCFGLTDEYFAALGPSGSLEPVASALVGRRARLTLGQREWAGEMRNEVKGVKPYTGAPVAGQPNAGPVMAPPVTGPVAPPAAPLAHTPAPAPAPTTPTPAPVQQPAPVQVPAPAAQPAPVAPPAATSVVTPAEVPAATEAVSTPATTPDAGSPPPPELPI